MFTMVVMKCRQCDAPMNVTRKDRPEKLPANIEWLICRQCNRGVEVINNKDDPSTQASAPQIEAKSADKLDFEEKVTITNYITITKITAKDGSITTTKQIFSDSARKILVNTEQL